MPLHRVPSSRGRPADTAAPDPAFKAAPRRQAELLRLLQAKRRLSRPALAALIASLCAERPYTARELAGR